MRYVFHPLKHKPGYVIAFDTLLNEPVAEMVNEHAQMIYLMYVNVSKKLGDVAGDEFMYGHILGITLTLIHAKKYATVDVKELDGKRMVVFRDPVTGDSSLKDIVISSNETKMTESLMGRVIGTTSMDKVKQKRGFAVMNKSLVTEISRRGGKAAQEKGTGHVFNSETARKAAYKSHEARRQGVSSVASVNYSRGSDV